MSIAGGLHKAVERAAAVGCDCLQIFTANPRSFPANSADLRFGKFLTKNTNQWRGKPITPQEVQTFREAIATSAIACPLAHDSYLINLASPEKTLWKKSIDALVDEVQRAAALGIPRVVCHPGAYTTTSESEGLKRIIAALDEVLSQTRDESAGILLETTAGQGTTLGWRFEHLAATLAGVKDKRRLGVCFDTCHVFAAGYKISTRSDYRATMKEFDKIVGLDQIRAFHLNDSVKDCGSRVDRHAHIGCGKIGPEAFGWLLRDRRFRNVPTYLDKKTPKGFSGIPMILETPKGEKDGVNWDIINLQTLRRLASRPEL
jgi:deoxyribonuclease-4